jgi:hypothetical protein
MYFENMTTKHQQPDRHDLVASSVGVAAAVVRALVAAMTKVAGLLTSSIVGREVPCSRRRSNNKVPRNFPGSHVFGAVPDR